MPFRFTNGDPVPEGLKLRKEGRRWFVTLENGQEVVVFTAKTLSHLRLRFENGNEVDELLQRRKEGKCWYVTLEDGQEVEAFASGSATSTLRSSKLRKFYSELQNRMENNDASLDSYLSSLERRYRSAMIAHKKYEVVRWAAENGHLNVMEYLLGEIKPKDLSKTITANVFDLAGKNNHVHVITFLLNIPSVFSLAEEHPQIRDKCIIPFVKEKLLTLERAQLTFEETNSNGVFNIEDDNESTLSLCILRHLICRNDPLLLDDLQRLINIPSVNLLIHQAAEFQRDNELLYRALVVGNMDAARLLIAVPAVQVLAEQNDYYRIKSHTSVLHVDKESSMRALPAAEQKRMQRAIEHYDPKLQELTVPVIMDNLRDTLCARYKAKPAQIISDVGITIVLPMNWKDFEALNFCKKGLERQPSEHQRALEAYYQHKDHTAFRYLLKPNPWIHSEALYVKVNDLGTERWAYFDGYEPLISMLFLAASDEHIEPCDGFTLDTRLEHFIDEVAHIGRAHNWDNGLRLRRDAEGNSLVDEGLSLTEDYDDLGADRPSCYSGAKTRLFQSVLGHPLFTLLTPDIVEQKLYELVREHFKAAIDPDNCGKFKKAWDDIQNDDLEYEERLTAAEILKELNINPKQQSALIYTLAHSLNETYNKQFDEDIGLTVVVLKRLRLDKRDKFATHASQFSCTNWHTCLEMKVIHDAAIASKPSAMGFFSSTMPGVPMPVVPMDEESAAEPMDEETPAVTMYG